MHRTKFPHIDYTVSKWEVLRALWNSLPESSLEFTIDNLGWRIEEHIEDDKVFSLRRDVVTQRRYTDIDKYGLLGLSLINPQDTTVAITEGVSDYISTKLLKPNTNVLGVTTLGGSALAKKILVSIFDRFVVIADNDETGVSNAMRWKKFLESYNKKVKIWKTSNSRFKDITDQFLFNLRLDHTQVIIDGM